MGRCMFWKELTNSPLYAFVACLLACELYYNQETESPLSNNEYVYLLQRVVRPHRKFVQECHPWAKNLTTKHFSTANLQDLIPEQLKEPAKKWGQGELTFQQFVDVARCKNAVH